MVLIAGPEMVEDLRRAPDDQVSFSDALEGVSPGIVIISVTNLGPRRSSTPNTQLATKLCLTITK